MEKKSAIKWLIPVFLLVTPPIGIFLIWQQKIGKTVVPRIILTIIFGLYTLILIAALTTHPQDQSKPNQISHTQNEAPSSTETNKSPETIGFEIAKSDNQRIMWQGKEVKRSQYWVILLEQNPTDQQLWDIYNKLSGENRSVYFFNDKEIYNEVELYNVAMISKNIDDKEPKLVRTSESEKKDIQSLLEKSKAQKAA